MGQTHGVFILFCFGFWHPQRCPERAGTPARWPHPAGLAGRPRAQPTALSRPEPRRRAAELPGRAGMRRPGPARGRGVQWDSGRASFLPFSAVLADLGTMETSPKGLVRIPGHFAQVGSCLVGSFNTGGF